MISHFQWKELKNNLIRKEWQFSFFFKGAKYVGTYSKDGSIRWLEPTIHEADRKFLETQVHDLFLYHVYEEH